MVTKDEASPRSQCTEGTRERTEGDTCQRVAGLMISSFKVASVWSYIIYATMVYSLLDMGSVTS